MTTARNSLLAASAGAVRLPEDFPVFPEPDQAAIFYSEMSYFWDLDDPENNLGPSRWMSWGSRDFVERYPKQNICIVFFIVNDQVGSDSFGDPVRSLQARVYDYRDPSNIQISEIQHILNMYAGTASSANDVWNEVDYVPTTGYIDYRISVSRDCLVGSFAAHAIDGIRHQMIFTITLDVSTLEVSANWKEGHATERMSSSWSGAGHIFKCNSFNNQGMIAYEHDWDDSFAIEVFEIQGIEVNGSRIDDQIVVDELGLKGFWSTTPQEPEKSPQYLIGICHIGSNFWCLGVHAMQSTSIFSSVGRVHVMLVQATMESLTLIDEYIVGEDYWQDFSDNQRVRRERIDDRWMSDAIAFKDGIVHVALHYDDYMNADPPRLGDDGYFMYEAVVRVSSSGFGETLHDGVTKVHEDRMPLDWNHLDRRFDKLTVWGKGVAWFNAEWSWTNDGRDGFSELTTVQNGQYVAKMLDIAPLVNEHIDHPDGFFWDPPDGISPSGFFPWSRMVTGDPVHYAASDIQNSSILPVLFGNDYWWNRGMFLGLINLDHLSREAIAAGAPGHYRHI